MSPTTSPIARWRREESGAAAVEFAIVSIVLLVFLYGTLMYGFIFGVDNSITHAAEEGARAAISQATGVTQVAHAEQVALDRLSWLGGRISASDVTAEVFTCAPPDDAYDCIHVRVVYPWKERPIIPPILNIGVPAEITAESIVQLD